jgi:hypothetical protein
MGSTERGRDIRFLPDRCRIKAPEQLGHGGIACDHHRFDVLPVEGMSFDKWGEEIIDIGHHHIPQLRQTTTLGGMDDTGNYIIPIPDLGIIG